MHFKQKLALSILGIILCPLFLYISSRIYHNFIDSTSTACRTPAKFEALFNASLRDFDISINLDSPHDSFIPSGHQNSCNSYSTKTFLINNPSAADITMTLYIPEKEYYITEICIEQRFANKEPVDYDVQNQIIYGILSVFSPQSVQGSCMTINKYLMLPWGPLERESGSKNLEGTLDLCNEVLSMENYELLVTFYNSYKNQPSTAGTFRASSRKEGDFEVKSLWFHP